MDGWLKGLVAAACIVVIAQGTYFGWHEIQRQIALHKLHNAQQEAKATVDAHNARLKQMAECGSAMDRLYTYETFDLPEGKKPKTSLTDTLKRCAANDMLSGAHLAEAKPYL